MSRKRDIEKGLEEAAGWNPMRTLSGFGVRSNHLYIAGLVSIGVSVVTWLFSRRKNDSKSQCDRCGPLIGEWAPTLFAVGVGLTLEEGKK